MNDRPTIEHQPKVRASILYGVAFIAMAVVMAVLHWLITGISADFGGGFVVGILFAFGLLGLLSKSIRELP